MISDVLSEAVDEVDRYLNDFEDMYRGSLRRDILALRDEMERMRARLDTCPGDEPNPVRPFEGRREIE